MHGENGVDVPGASVASGVGCAGASNNSSESHGISSKVLKCTLSSVHRVNEGGTRHTYRAFLSLRIGDEVSYRPGDSISVYAPNSLADTEWLLQRMDGEIQADDIVMLKQYLPLRKASICRPLGEFVTPRTLIRNCLELHSLATRKTLRVLATLCGDEEEKKILLKIGGREGTKLYDELIKSTSATVMDLLATFKSCRLSLNHLFELFPPLCARHYSLVEESTGKPTRELSITFTMVDFLSESKENTVTCDGVTLKRYEREKGVATGYIYQLWKEKYANEDGPYIHISLRPNLNKFLHPGSVCDPLILICAGTGIAPFISFLQYRRRIRRSQASEIGEMWLIFGCRNPNFDLLFAEELADFLDDSTLTYLCLCFSRFRGPLPSHLPEAIRSKALVPPGCKYVQDCILSSFPVSSLDDDSPEAAISDKLDNIHISPMLKGISLRLAQLVCENGGHVRVCGDTKGMVPCVAEAWKSLFEAWKQSSANNLSKAPADFLVELRKTHRYVDEAWR